jgi:hypothetical protein
MSSILSSPILEKITNVKNTIISYASGETTITSELKRCVLVYGLIIFFTLLTAISLYYVSTDNNIVNSEKYIYAFITFIPLILLIVAAFFIFNKNIKLFNLIVGLSIVGIVFIFCYYFNKILSFGKKYGIFFNIILQIIIFSIICVGLAIVFSIFEKKIRSLRGSPGLIVNLIFLIPCLLTEFIEYIKDQLKITPNITFVLFIIEIIFILLYIYIPYLFTAKILQETGKPLLKESLFLNKKTNIAKTSDLEPINKNEFGNSINMSQQSTDIVQDIDIRKNYAFSMWIYLNEQQSFSSEKNIFNYGSASPMISYTNVNTNTKSINEHINIAVNSSETMVYKFEIPRQKWNNIVFNYNNSSVDIFINGNLERSVNFNGDHPTYSPVDLVSVGDENGVDGAICNVEFYSTPLTQFHISTKYNILMNKNPPTNY